MKIDDLYILIGETLDFCQRIEKDIKLIYAGMKKGNIEDNLYLIKRFTLGETIIELELLDNCDNKPFLKERDYDILKSITKERNHICHKCFNNYNYISDYDLQEKMFDKEYERIKTFHDKIDVLWRVIEKVRLDVLKKYGRI
jgi:hypothetical protein